MPTDNITFILGRLEGKVDSLLVISRQQAAALAEHDNRIRKLELARSYVLGVAVTVAAISSLLTHFLGKT
jgi:hypothetical protein